MSNKKPKRKRAGTPVVAYTPTTAVRYESKAECAKAYGISRHQLDNLLRTGEPLDDGVTAFDEPIY
ncbi:MAG TPA: hypothetical protein P5168_02380 [Candidatus Methanomethylicus sp.]|nr:hypothetical protein [Candidatus Methanomethylicus sp.]